MNDNVYDINAKLAEREIEFIADDVVRKLTGLPPYQHSIKTAVKEALKEYIERAKRIGR